MAEHSRRSPVSGFRLRCLCTAVAAVCFACRSTSADEVSYSKDIRPLLAAKCLACHGPDDEARQADLRLDVRDSAVEIGAIVPGKPEESTLVERISSTDPDVQMPPADSGKSLTDEQKELLRRWIEQGAEFNQHWAFIPPVRPEPPHVVNTRWPRNDIDRFTLATIEQAGLTPSPEADRYTLIRRIYLDLIGLLPTPEEADAFVRDRDPEAYEHVVDRLLESEKYGERWARAWLDLARYADTNGYEKDRPRSVWPYRDWVIKALNADMPFDRFTIEQLAGDMLPSATLDQQIATGFHRNTMLNEEGGIDPLEYRFYAMVDRVATTGTVWMGLTTGCAQCHTHKYDPITHTDYYSLMALLDNADEPDLQVPSAEVLAQRQSIEAKIAALEASLPEQFPQSEVKGEEASCRESYEAAYQSWIDETRQRAVRWQVLRPTRMESNLPRLEVLKDGSIFSTGDITKRDVFTLTFPLQDLGKRPITGVRIEALPDERLPARGPGRAFYEGRKGDFFLSEVTPFVDGSPLTFANASQHNGKLFEGKQKVGMTALFDRDGSTGWGSSGRPEPMQVVLNFPTPVSPVGNLSLQLLFERHYANSLGRFRVSFTTEDGHVAASDLPTELESALARADEETLDPALDGELRRFFLRTSPQLKEARKPIDVLRAKLPDVPTTLVMQERPADNPRPTYLHHRGEYLQPKEPVSPRVPEVFPTLPEGEPANRLTFARWLVSDRNPLVARVTADRAWGAFFGAPFVRTNGDYGTQSDLPTHPELLDWLAVEFRERGWSFKQLHRLIVTSATYRQSSAASTNLLRRDPENRLLARGPRFRVEAEVVRDALLEAGGLLSPKMYGPSVYPPQPESVVSLAYGAPSWPVSTGEDRYRRSLYTFTKRTAPFASYMAFDGTSGEVCIARRERSNTPLQALTLLNDEMYIEMAQALARFAVNQIPEADSHGDSSDVDRARAEFLFRRLLTRPPTRDELDSLLAFHARQVERLKEGELTIATIAGDEHASADVAAWTMTARALMNLDETITKE